MKNIKYLAACALAFTLALVSCEDETLSPYLEPEAGAHAFGELEKDGKFDESDIPGSSVDVALRWVSVDKKVKIDKIELYVNFLEEYVDKDGNPAVAVHGGKTGVLLPTSLSGLENRTPGNVNITAAQVYQLFKDAKFKYDGATEVAVFGNPTNPRPTNAQFLPGDSFSLTWRLYSADGKVYKSWSPSVCTELRGANCSVDWFVE
ncbi:MAG: hypothetical protein H7Z75_20870 [Ferruginibacter sp.]|nr:hypothetical protein [Cytophagales bacterium]